MTPRSDQNAHSPPRILLVEDEAIVAAAEKRLLKKNGYFVERVATGVAAVDRVGRAPAIDLVLMDIDLGDGIDGTEATRRILRRHELPVVFLTGHQEKEMVGRVKGITRYGYVLKDSGEFVLCEAIAMALELFEAHRKLSESEHWLRTIVDTLPDEFWAMNRDREYVMQNAESRRRIGNALGKRLEDLDVPPETAATWRENDSRAFAGERVESQYRYFVDGEERFGETTTVPLKISGGVPFIMGLTRDITDSKRIEERLRSREKFLGTLIATSPVGIALFDTNGRVTFANDQAATALGFRPGTLEGRLYTEISSGLTSLDGNPRKDEEYAFVRVRDEGTTIRNVRHGATWPDGSRHYVSVNASPLTDAQGGLTAVVLAIHDITPEQQAINALKESEDRYRRLFEDAPVGMFRSHSSGRIIDANPTMTRFLSFESLEEARSKFQNLAQQLYVHPEDREEFLSTLREEGSVDDFRFEANRRDGSTIWLALSARISETEPDGGFVISGYASPIPGPHEERDKTS